MSRVIKYRAWDEYAGAMLEMGEFEIAFEEDNGFHGYRYHQNGDFVQCELIQFTGLQDSKGVDVYGDDLLDDKWRAQVYWKNGSWWVHFHVGDNADRLLYAYLKSREQAKCPVEVIGNIHENPELLEVES